MSSGWPYESKLRNPHVFFLKLVPPNSYRLSAVVCFPQITGERARSYICWGCFLRRYGRLLSFVSKKKGDSEHNILCNYMKVLVYNAQLEKHLQIQHTRPCEVHVYLRNI